MVFCSIELSGLALSPGSVCKDDFSTLVLESSCLVILESLSATKVFNDELAKGTGSFDNDGNLRSSFSMLDIEPMLPVDEDIEDPLNIEVCADIEEAGEGACRSKMEGRS